MSREILFRGKRIDNGEWIEGSLITNGFYTEKDHESIPYILNADMAEYDCFEDFNEYNGIYAVDEETICQHTGLTDKNGKKIFEGDIVRYGEICGEVKFGLHESNWQICKYNQGFYIEFQEESLYRKELGYWENKVVVIGNIYDSPKLLEDKENKHGEDI